MTEAVDLDDRAVLGAWSTGAGGRWGERCRLLAQLALGDPADSRPWDEAQQAMLLLAATPGDTAATVGDTLAVCPACATVAEAPVAVAALAVAESAQRPPHETSGPLRVPTVGDVIDASTLEHDDAAVLLEQCSGLADLPPDAREGALAALDEIHPLLAPSFDVTCPDCATEFSVLLDAVELVWGAIEVAATGIVDDVVALASAFGWSEDEVLSVPRRRRAVYRRMAAEQSAT